VNRDGWLRDLSAIAVIARFLPHIAIRRAVTGHILHRTQADSADAM
jgi:hypothetical protein